ncbi:MAG: site-specific tyrosine recombinase XerD [Verrucomicrobia bacterium]|nr:site-specific tyrosine recombinase XerD [Kiritimatiellia bacterium]MCO6400387.1 site-specific tyrosine recombinase XerD [Verrucomicrobiota bacterium]
MQVLLDQFLDYITLEKGLTSNTRSAYASDLVRFLAFIQRAGVALLNKLTRRHILDYLMWEKEQGLAAPSLSRRLVAIRVFLRYLQQEGMLSANVTETMDSPKLWKLLPATLTTAEVERLLQTPRLDKPLGLRNRALLETLYGTGLRVSELASLKLEDIQFDAGYLRCLGKGRKERVVPLGGAAATYLKKYLNEARAQLDRVKQSEFVFLSTRGQALSRKTIWQLIRRCTREAGITKNVSPHTLRHSFASHLLANNAPLRVIQEMLGHADIATTQIYTHVDAPRLQQIHRQYHPRA